MGSFVKNGEPEQWAGPVPIERGDPNVVLVRGMDLLSNQNTRRLRGVRGENEL